MVIVSCGSVGGGISCAHASGSIPRAPSAPPRIFARSSASCCDQMPAFSRICVHMGRASGFEGISRNCHLFGYVRSPLTTKWVPPYLWRCRVVRPVVFAHAPPFLRLPLSRVTWRGRVGGRGAHPAMIRTCTRAAALSIMPGKRRRSSIMAESSPSSSNTRRITAASISLTANILREWVCAGGWRNQHMSGGPQVVDMWPMATPDLLPQRCTATEARLAGQLRGPPNQARVTMSGDGGMADRQLAVLLSRPVPIGTSPG